ncbi:MAG: hypothetical protein R2822_20360 [Spirosomataceae bacterium]
MLSLPKSFFYTAKSEQVNKEIKEYFKNKNPTKDAINSYIINRYKLTFSDLEDNIFVELGQDLKKNF